MYSWTRVPGQVYGDGKHCGGGGAHSQDGLQEFLQQYADWQLPYVSQHAWTGLCFSLRCNTNWRSVSSDSCVKCTPAPLNIQATMLYIYMSGVQLTQISTMSAPHQSVQAVTQQKGQPGGETPTHWRLSCQNQPAARAVLIHARTLSRQKSCLIAATIVKSLQFAITTTG
jgi:hypothetical protein